MSDRVDEQPPGGPVWRGLSSLIDDSRAMRVVEVIAVLTLLGVAAITWAMVSGAEGSQRTWSPQLAAMLLVANLLPASVLIMLAGRRAAIRRAAESSIGSKARLHVRLVGIFSLVATTTTLLVVIFASVLFQSGVHFWFSDSARNMFENAGNLARGYYEMQLRDVADESVVMAGDLRNYLRQSSIESQEFQAGFGYQALNRHLSEAAIVEVGPDGVQRTAAIASRSRSTRQRWISDEALAKLQQGAAVYTEGSPDRIEAVTPLLVGRNAYLVTTRETGVPLFSLGRNAQAVLDDYRALAEQSRNLQLKFNAALYLVSLAIIGLAVWIALLIADRLVRPVTALVHAAQRVAAGDLAVRVPEATGGLDEVGILGSAFNRMTERLEEQRGALVSANAQLDSRRALIETVLESVSAGVVSLDDGGRIRIANSTAQAILGGEGRPVIGERLATLAPALAELVASRRPQAVLQLGDGPEPRTLAANATQSAAGTVVTFEDISQQLSDQRRAAWSDVARRIAHEIKNPLTPIQLAAERLKRRYSKRVGEEDGTFDTLTATIVRQVGDLRKIVDEFSSFARMPKPVFRAESLMDMVRHSMLLQEVAHPDIAFTVESEAGDCELVCDRRQFGQALTNIYKNAVEAIAARRAEDPEFQGGTIATDIGCADERVRITISDNGVGLPPERERILEPYVTTRPEGTGLGLAVVQKVVEDHRGEVFFEDAPGGGTRVTLVFPRVLIADGAGAAGLARSAAAGPRPEPELEEGA